MCHGGGYILLSISLGFGAGNVFLRKKLKVQFPECFGGGGLECFTTWVKDGVKDGKFLFCKSEFYAQ